LKKEDNNHVQLNFGMRKMWREVQYWKQISSHPSRLWSHLLWVLCSRIINRIR